MTKATAIGGVGNGAQEVIEFSTPYAVKIAVEGTCPILFKKWDTDEVEAKSKAAKGSKAKKEDNPETCVYRDEEGNVCIPTEYFRQSLIHAAKFRQDPRSPRKSAMDLFKAGVASLTDLCSLGTKNWDYLDKRRVTIQKTASITRIRPAMNKGWKAEFMFQVLLPEYIEPSVVNEVLQSAGRLIGVADFRPTFGRFAVTNFEVLS